MSGYIDRIFYNKVKDTYIIEDIKYGIYNPIANGKWHYTTKKNEILTVLKKFPCEELDSLLYKGTYY